ncbi:twin-arginine translocase TatA/TatE family subunit [Demequina zhanjiangensis]|uniref:Twin-arginine translocase TatA/TatE family subunit n=1 Tax=Demequina zhanjiangensis TaxID=3051659 RepID=A0ABT8G0Z5_9MICO|nr:twin-arginine translocase TatA/TatE family subunit [Demequina sp. SYSU T00b26]MDN4472810.1 twin-arginine translocase TatA/TatE family subunit [Demequina sp. SYSU T00b26]
MFDINGSEFLIIIVIAMIVIGPQRLPEYAKQLREWVRRGRDLLRQGQQSLKQEVGTDVDWSQYDPRQYDPRRIVREALAEETPPPDTREVNPRVPRKRHPLAKRSGAAPFDPEST